MKWLLIMALWNTNPPQDSFKFFTKAFDTEEECNAALQEIYNEAFNRGIHAQAACSSEQALGLAKKYY